MHNFFMWIITRIIAQTYIHKQSKALNYQSTKALNLGKVGFEPT